MTSAKTINKKYGFTQVAIRLVRERKIMSDIPIDSPEAAIDLCMDMLSDYDRESVIIINLHQDGKPININMVHMGALTCSMICPREIMKAAILSNAAALIMVHNHPSGSLKPSKDDVAATERLIQVGALMGIPVRDHVITGPDKKYCSMFVEGICKFTY